MPKERNPFGSELGDLHSMEWFQRFIKDGEHGLNDVPQIPEWSEDRHLVEWAYASGLRNGYQLCLSKLGVEDV